jgi:2-polyprenyl-3-methyl-5-hydroxy-6-metoxy-1,4-benzoquinol methylase
VTGAHRRLLHRFRRLFLRTRARLKWVVSLFRPYQPMLGGRELLDTEYRGGNWDYLAEDLELPRFSVVAGYCVRHAEGGRILEIGCGEGLLPERIGTSRYARYVGVDISSVAIERAKAKRHPNAEFLAEDASDFDPDAQFDLIVFNEVLEYAPRPVDLVRRYERWLTDELHQVYAPVARTQVTTATELTWVIELLRKASDSPRR